MTVTLRTGVNMEEKTGGEGEACACGLVIGIYNVPSIIIFFLGHEEILEISE